MKRINLFLLLLLSTLSFAQSWQSKDVVRIENTESSFHYTFYDSTTLYIQKQNVSYIVSLPNSNYIQVGYLYEGATSKIMSCTYNTLTQPVLSSNSELVDTLNAWLNEPSSGGGGGSQTLSISNDTLSISNGNSVVLPIGASSLFPNGIEFVSASRDFQTSDQGKILLLLGDNIEMTMPTGLIFEDGKNILLKCYTNAKFNSKNAAPLVNTVSADYGDGNDSYAANRQEGEAILFVCYKDGGDGNSLLIPISTFEISDENNIRKTALKYLYDKSQTVPTLQSVTDSGAITTNSITVANLSVQNGSLTIGSAVNSSQIRMFDQNNSGIETVILPPSISTGNNITIPTSNGYFATSVNGVGAGTDGNIDITDEVNTIVGNSRFFISRSASTTDADFNATPGTAYMLLEVADNDKVITLTSPVDGDIYRFNNVTQPTNNWITNVTIFLSDGTTSNVVPASKITIIQYDAASSVFHQISSQ